MYNVSSLSKTLISMNSLPFKNSVIKNNIPSDSFFEVNTNFKNIESDYNKAKETFNKELNSNIDSLKKSSKDLKKTDFNFSKDDLTEEKKDGKTVTKKSDKLKDTLKKIGNFLSDRNDINDFLKENKEISKRVSNLHNSFSDTIYKSKQLSEIGIHVDRDGNMKVDEDKLADSLVKDSKKTEDIIKNLVDKTIDKTTSLESQKEKLFPNISAMMGKDYDRAKTYTGQSLLNIASYSYLGNMFEMYA